MPYLTADEIYNKLKAKELYKFMRRACNQTITAEEERHKVDLCNRAASLDLTEREVDAWLDDENTTIDRFWAAQESTSEEEDEATGSDDDSGTDANGEDFDDADATMDDAADESSSANLSNLNQAAGSSSSSLPIESDPTPRHLTDEQIRLIREAESTWNSRRLEMMAAGLEDTFENWIYEEDYERLGQLRTEAVLTNVNEFYALTLGWGLKEA